MTEGLAVDLVTSLVSDVGAWAAIGSLLSILGVWRKVHLMHRTLFGERAVDNDDGVLGKLYELEDRVDEIEADRRRRTFGKGDQNND